MFIETLANIVFPPICLRCRRNVKDGTLCELCFGKIAIRDTLLCGECHAPLPLLIDRNAKNDGCESFCHPSFPYVLGAATDYADETVQTLVHHLKFRSIKGAAEPLAELIIRYLKNTAADTASLTVIPIPLSPRRLRTRGYNQAECIAQPMAAALDLPIATDVLIRAHHAKPQSETSSAAERRENIIGAYAIRDSEPARAAIRGVNILLIDDVSTSGATFLEASRVLKAAGAKKIVAIAAAKT
jgi:ComF family protein